MFDYRLEFDSPWYLLLLLVLPVLWWLSYRSLAGLGWFRRLLALTIRSVILLGFIFALAEIQLVQVSNHLTVIFLLDQSQSVPVTQRKAMIRYVNEAIKRGREDRDLVGVIVFGKDAAIEIPPFDDDVRLTDQIESFIDAEHTDLAGALKLAQASLQEDGSRRIVIISDGNENLNKGEGIKIARGLAERGIGIDVRPVRLPPLGDVAVEKLTVPSDIRKGQPFDLVAVLTNSAVPVEGEQGDVTGRLVITQKTDDQPNVLSDEKITLEPGKRAYSIRQNIDEPAFYQWEAQFIPDDPATDPTQKNNRATTFTHVRGQGQVLFIENHEEEAKGEHAYLVERLRRSNLEVTVRQSNQLPTELPELQPYDTVILANVPREHFSDEQIAMLVSNTEHMGAGLIMLGGPNSFGAGGWAGTDLEKAMPVDFQIKSAKVVPKGALALLMHASEIAQGNYWQKRIASESISALGERDYCGLIHYSDFAGDAAWLWNHPRGMMPVGPNRDKMKALLDRMTPGDMPDFDPGMVLAANAFAQLKDAAIKHMIIVSDGDPTPPSNRALQALKDMKVTVSTVAVGSHGPATSAVLRSVATATGGKYYEVTDNRALPRIFQKEARKVARPLIDDKPPPFSPVVRYPHEMIQGIDGDFPATTGFVMTTVKENPLVEVSLLAPRKSPEENCTLLASWNYGLGRAVAFTSDAGARWTTEWTNWEGYDKFFSQMVRWSMRPSGDEGKFTVATDAQDGVGEITVTALDKDDAFLNFLDMNATLVGPDMKPMNVRLKQTHAGRYTASFDAQTAGSYFILISPGAGKAPIRTGLNVAYSSEFRDRTSNESLLKALADVEPKGGAKGKLIVDPDAKSPEDAEQLEDLVKTNVFRRDLAKGRTSQDAWHLLILAAGCLFFSDVFVRRVTLDLTWIPPLAVKTRDWLFRRELREDKPEFMDRLKSRKAEVGEQLEHRRAAARFEPSPDAATDVAVLEAEMAAPIGPPKSTKPAQDLGPKAEEDSYTSRLLKAKKKVWDERKN